MPTMLQIRNLPDALHRALKIRAAEEGVSMSDWVTARIREGLERPSHRELLERLARRSVASYELDAADLIREDRGDLPGLLLAAEGGGGAYGAPGDERE